jgi:hypothetical protein
MSLILRSFPVTLPTMLFLRPTVPDVEHLQQLLQTFRKVMGLCTNIAKSEILPIRCDQIELSGILGQFQAMVGALPCKYLGLTLWVVRLRREDKQVLIDKVSDKLLGWKGKLLNKVERLALVNLVLPSVVICHMTVFPLSMWAIKRIDRMRRAFLWQGAEEPWRGHCLVNWKWVQRPKKTRGLGIVDLEWFNMAFRIR